MNIKSSQNSSMNNEKKKRIMQVGAVFLGTLLLTGCAQQTNKEEVINATNQEVEWSEPSYPYLFGNKKEIRAYEKHNGKYEENEVFAENMNDDLELESNSDGWYTWTEDKISDSVIRGDYGNGEERKNALEKEGYNYDNIQSLVNLKCYNQDYVVYASEFIFDSDRYVPLSSRLGSFPSYVLSDDGETLEKNGYFINYLDENGELQTAYYDNDGVLKSDSKDEVQESSR